MKENPQFIPSGSQTVGPFFTIGLDYMANRVPNVAAAAPGTVEISGRVLDSTGNPVRDALLEFWTSQSAAHQDGFPGGFYRIRTGDDGRYCVSLQKPESGPYPGGGRQAPHLLVLVFCRGLLRNLVTRVYFGHEPTNDADPILLSVDSERRPTLIAQRISGRSDAFEWNIVLQGADETVFFAW